jgi:citrate lyase subunit beta/citryl-CoA lyase
MWQRARRDGFNGMMALHPAQVPIINAGFTPGPMRSPGRRIVAAFAQNPDSGA